MEAFINASILGTGETWLGYLGGELHGMKAQYVKSRFDPISDPISFKSGGTMEQAVLTKEQYTSLSRQILHELATRFRIIPLNDLPDSTYCLRKPLLITLELDDGQVIASLDEIEAFAYADTEYEAIELLCVEIVELYEELVLDDQPVGPLPQKWRKFLKHLLGLHAENPKKLTNMPTTERLLQAFSHVTLTTGTVAGHAFRHVSPLSALQSKILNLLGMSDRLYYDLGRNST